MEIKLLKEKHILMWVQSRLDINHGPVWSGDSSYQFSIFRSPSASLYDHVYRPQYEYIVFDIKIYIFYLFFFLFIQFQL